MIDHERKFIFIHIPKTGGNSVKKILGIKGHEHKPFALYSKNHPDYFSFAFTRNPWDRLVSAFHYIKRGGINEYDQRMCDKYIGGISFTEFVLKYQKKMPPVTHFCFQWKFLDGDVDFVGKCENLQQDFNIVCDKIGIPHQKLPYKNKSKHKHYTEYYDDETRQIVAEKYTKDIEYFGYKFGE